jgi:hypothetical protein
MVIPRKPLMRPILALKPLAQRIPRPYKGCAGCKAVRRVVHDLISRTKRR